MLIAGGTSQLETWLLAALGNLGSSEVVGLLRIRRPVVETPCLELPEAFFPFLICAQPLVNHFIREVVVRLS